MKHAGHETEFGTAFAGSRLAGFRRRLLRWYGDHGRDLPWRQSHDPYRVWISEIMLQQTTVTAVVPFFERFLERFPTADDVAAADEQEVLRFWEGLGYYSRARNIHKAARMLAAEYDGQFPADVYELMTLPGIGRYSAGAIASFAFDKPAPIVEANTLRLYCRLLGFDGDPRTSRGQKLLWAFAERLVPKKSPGRFNHALMDLGATVCRVSEPDCPECPLKQYCAAFRDGTAAEIPASAKKPEITEVTEAAVVIRKNGRVLLRQCQPGERWAGLWDFPRFALPVKFRPHDPNDQPDGDTTRLLMENMRNLTGIEADINDRLTEMRHSVTRYRIHLLCYSATALGGRLPRNGVLKWVRRKALDDYPLSVTGRKISRLICEDRAG